MSSRCMEKKGQEPYLTYITNQRAGVKDVQTTIQWPR